MWPRKIMGNLCLAAITIQACDPDFPPLCHQDDYFSPILPEDTFQIQSVPAETAQLGLAKNSQRISLHWMFNSDVEHLNEPFLYVCKHNATSSIPSSSASSPQKEPLPTAPSADGAKNSMGFLQIRNMKGQRGSCCSREMLLGW